MKTSLSPGAIGLKTNQMEAIELAHYYGFQAVEPQAEYIRTLDEAGAAKLRDALRGNNVVWGSAGLRINLPAEDAAYAEDMSLLPATAKALRAAGVARGGRWISPASDALTYSKNFKLHVARVRQAAEILDDQGIRLGLEYVGPKTSWASRRYPFIHTMAEARELIAEVGKKNVGLIIDSWHWYTSGESGADIQALTNSDVVSIDLNDAPAGVPVDRQIDSKRELPAATGVIDIKTFLDSLRKIKFDGPIRAEPFNAALRAMPKEQALAASIASLRKALAL